MYDLFNNNNLLADQQYGNRKIHLTEFTAVKLIDYISNQVESGNTPGNLHTDLSRAFDTLSFDTLLHNCKLKYYDLFGNSLKL